MTNDRRRKKKIQIQKNDSRFELPWDRPVTFDTLANRANLTGVLVPHPRARPLTAAYFFFLFAIPRGSPLCCREICGEHFESRGDEDEESSVFCDPSVSCNSCLWRQNMRPPLSHIKSLPLSADGSAIQFHTSSLRLRQR